MTDKNLLLAMGHIDPKLIAEASPDVPYKKKARNKWVKWGAMAACLIFLLPVLIMYMFLQKKFITSIASTGIVG